MEPSHLKLKDYIVLDSIAEGTYGEVYRVQHRTTGQIYALKVLLLTYLMKVRIIHHSGNEASRRAD